MDTEENHEDEQDQVLLHLERLLQEWTWLCDQKCTFRVRPPDPLSDEHHPYQTEHWSPMSNFKLVIFIRQQSAPHYEVGTLRFKRLKSLWQPVGFDEKPIVKQSIISTLRLSMSLLQQAVDLRQDLGVKGIIEVMRYIRHNTNCMANIVFRADTPLYGLRSQPEQIDFKTIAGVDWSSKRSLLQGTFSWQLDVEPPSINCSVVMRSVL